MRASSTIWARLARRRNIDEDTHTVDVTLFFSGAGTPAKDKDVQAALKPVLPCTDILKSSVVPAELSPRAIRWPAGPAAGPDPEAGDQHLRHPHRPDHAAVSGIHAEGRGDGYRAERGIRLHGGDADPHQVAHAAAARSGARQAPAGRRSAPGTGRPPAGARALQVRRRDAATEARGGRSGVVESADRAVSRRRRRSRPGGHAVRPGENLPERDGSGQEPAGLRGRRPKKSPCPT